MISKSKSLLEVRIVSIGFNDITHAYNHLFLEGKLDEETIKAIYDGHTYEEKKENSPKSSPPRNNDNELFFEKGGLVSGKLY